MAKSLDGLHPELMRPRVEAVLADPEAIALGLFVVSAFRSVEYQQKLWDAAVKKYGSEKAARKWVAPPGKSNHGPKVDGFGTAVDFGIPGHAAVSGQWPAELEASVNRICERHGLRSPMEWEDWHFEPIPKWVAPASKPKGGKVVVPNYFKSLDAPNGGVWHAAKDGGVFTDSDGAGGPDAPYFGSVPEVGGLGDAKVGDFLPHKGGYKFVARHADDSISYFHFPAS